MLDDVEVDPQDLAIDEIRELLLEAGADISLEQAEQLAAFLATAGGIEPALAALAQLT
ncbi:MAG: hypothetical protein WD872_03925 [Pirellulaceae bacterium]